ncbi:precorrin-6y C5,15-methyltransferase (decarboxylating) subunit CbiE [uncultured Propionivibrio sp.]|uniref:precorrin-6y C5,15-methyltransferase (decarboxylating) subunit CbiE n=1 Tax=uncultured Propionivibrio sp. TaxID=426737 RepID=UPI0029C03A2B|nr:precorrin-6y C5,15-methyltransferase (decarboxylating) subunit CbiE [uncultured Propionivibrio sp.]
MSHCTLIGILDDGWAGLADAARERIAAAGVVIGARRTLELVRPHLAAGAITHDMDGALAAVADWTRDALAAGQPVAVLATGDPLCHGLAAWLDGKLGGKLDILPNLSTLQLACTRFKQPWNDIAIASCHGKDAGEWFVGATPAHGLYAAMRAIALNTAVFLFTGPENTPARLARALRLAGYADDEITLSVACRLQLPDETLFPALTLDVAAATDFPTPNVVLVQRRAAAPMPAFGLEDLEYIQRSPEKGLITKQEARAVSLAKLRIAPAATVWDIGAGAGSIGLEAARLAPHGHVWAIEKNAGDAANARANAARFRLGNYTLMDGKAPEHLDTWPNPDAVFIGGSGGELAGLIRLILDRLNPGGRLVMNFVTLENLATATTALADAGAAWDVIQLQASRSQPILDMHRMAAQNPVWIITASKPQEAPHD